MPLASKTVVASKFFVGHNFNILLRSYRNILLEKLWSGNSSWKIIINDNLDILLLILIEVWKDPLFPSFWVTELLWDLNFLEKLWSGNSSWKITINDSLDILLLILIEVWKYPLFPSFRVSKLLWNFNILQKMMPMIMIIFINKLCNLVVVALMSIVHIDLVIMEI